MNRRITSAIIKKSKFLINDFAHSLHLKKVKLKPGKRVIIYHGVTTNANKRINARFISTEEFEKQLVYFNRYFNVVSLTDYFEESNHPESKFTVALTFDDGYLNNLTEVLPLLEKYKVPATFFITTIKAKNHQYLWADLLDLFRHTGPDQFFFRGVTYHKKKNEYVANGQSLKRQLKKGDWAIKKELSDIILKENSFMNVKSLHPYFQLLNNEQIKQLSESEFATIGSHALYHNCLTQVDLKTAREELEKSKTYLENVTGKKVNFFAYPDGDYNEQLTDLTAEVGYKKQLLVDYKKPEHKNDLRLEERLGINPYISLKNQMQCIINGHY